MASRIELLAPAKDLECGIAAINHGADAVYVGAPQFGARSAVGNSIADIEKLCRYAHQYHAHVHVALNTILTNEELERARKMIFQLYDAGIDALIIQDMGILELDIPPVAIHASTQTDNRTKEKILFWEQIGLQRAILARELSLHQIQEIRKATRIDLECFVHGALCVSYSGQCYMSQACVGRSANRGKCAQFCRLPYTLTDADGHILKQNSHLLSLKDMNRARSLQALMDAGITSFKIEGRLKNIDYVKNITAFYRQKLDAILEHRTDFRKSSSGQTTFMFTPDPAKTFNRGATEYFLHQRENMMVSPDTSKSIGEPLGKITAINGNCFQINTDTTLHNGDGLSYLNAGGNLQGFRINKVDADKIFTLEKIAELNVGMTLYRNLDAAFAQQLSGESSSRKIDVRLLFQETQKGFLLTATDEDGIQITKEIQVTKEVASKAEFAIESLKKNLSKMGETIFSVKTITVETSQPYFFPAALVNSWRRDIAASLMKARVAAHPRPIGTPQKKQGILFPMNNDGQLTYTANIMNDRAEHFYRDHGAKETAPAFELAPSASAVVMTCKHCIRYTLGLCSKENNKLNEHWKFPLFLRHGQYVFQLDFDCSRCEMTVHAQNKKKETKN